MYDICDLFNNLRVQLSVNCLTCPAASFCAPQPAEEMYQLNTHLGYLDTCLEQLCGTIVAQRDYKQEYAAAWLLRPYDSSTLPKKAMESHDELAELFAEAVRNEQHWVRLCERCDKEKDDSVLGSARFFSIWGLSLFARVHLLGEQALRDQCKSKLNEARKLSPAERGIICIGKAEILSNTRKKYYSISRLTGLHLYAPHQGRVCSEWISLLMKIVTTTGSPFPIEESFSPSPEKFFGNYLNVPAHEHAHLLVALALTKDRFSFSLLYEACKCFYLRGQELSHMMCLYLMCERFNSLLTHPLNSLVECRILRLIRNASGQEPNGWKPWMGKTCAQIIVNRKSNILIPSFLKQDIDRVREEFFH